GDRARHARGEELPRAAEHDDHDVEHDEYDQALRGLIPRALAHPRSHFPEVPGGGASGSASEAARRPRVSRDLPPTLPPVMTDGGARPVAARRRRLYALVRPLPRRPAEYRPHRPPFHQGP